MVKVYIQYRCCKVGYPLGQTLPHPPEILTQSMNPSPPRGRFTLEPDSPLIMSQSRSPPSSLGILYDINGQNFKGKHSIAA